MHNIPGDSSESSEGRALRVRRYSSSILGKGFHKIIERQTRSSDETASRVEELTTVGRYKDEFLAKASHELRGPLAAIKNAVLVLGSPAAEAAVKLKAQAMIERQVCRMTRLVDDLLDVSRVIHRRLHLQRERIDLRVIVRNAIEEVEHAILARKHRLSVLLPDTPVWIQADPCRLEQVFANIIGNASRYTDVGGDLSVWMHMRVGQVVIRVRDSGRGIAPAVLPHVFDLFKQANTQDRHSVAGLGIGLALVRDLVELHGGTVTAASAGLGLGSEFAVRLCAEHQQAIDVAGVDAPVSGMRSMY